MHHLLSLRHASFEKLEKGKWKMVFNSFVLSVTSRAQRVSLQRNGDEKFVVE